MDRELEVIRDEMEQTRANLADKLGALETQVRETVSSASETVTSTVEGVKEVVETVSETVEGVTETFNISKHIEQHPWVAMGIALGAGFALAQVLGSGGGSQPQPAPQPPAPPQPPTPPEPSRRQEALPQLEMPQPQGSQDSSGILGQFGSALPSLEALLPDVKGIGETVISGLGGLAVGSVMAVVRDLVKDNLPKEWEGEIKSLVDQVTRQLGGKPQPEPERSGQEQEQGQGQEQPEQKNEEKPQGSAQQSDRSGGRRSGRPEPAYRG